MYTLTLLYVLHRSKTIGNDRVANTVSFGVSYPTTTVDGGLERATDEVSGAAVCGGDWCWSELAERPHVGLVVGG